MVNYSSSLSDVVRNEVVQKIVYDELVKIVNAIQTNDTSNLVKKYGYDTEISGVEKKTLDHDHGKFITMQEFNKLTADNFATRLAQVKLTTKADIADFVKETDFDNKLKNIN